MGLAAAAGIGAVGAIGASVISSNAANKATKVQQQEFNKTQQEQQPFLQTGTSALNQLAGIYGLTPSGTTGSGTTAATPGLDPNATFYQSPDYQFALSQGIKGVDSAAAARGMLDSGATRKAEIQYAGNLASGQFNNYANRLAQIAGIGQGSANALANVNQNFANNTGNIDLASGAANSNYLNSLLGSLNAANVSNQTKSSYSSGLGQFLGIGGSPGTAGFNAGGIAFPSVPGIPYQGIFG